MAKKLDGSVVLVTGASSGFGADAARLFARQGCTVALASRRIERLQELEREIRAAGGQAFVVPLDVSDSTQLVQAVHTIEARCGRIDILFNNAGFGRLDWLENMDLQADIQTQVDVNLTSLIQLTRLVLPGMLQRRSGTIINMSSVAGWISAPIYSVYAASKHGVRGFTNALRREVAPFGIHVCGIYPGGSTTEFGQHTGSPLSRSVFKKTNLFNIPSEKVARRVVMLARRPRRSVIMPWWYVPVLVFEQLFPGLVDWILKVVLVRRLHTLN